MVILKGCPKCHGDLHRVRASYEGIIHIEWHCLQCSREIPERKLLKTLAEAHQTCCNEDRRRALVLVAARFTSRKRIDAPSGSQASGSSSATQRTRP